MLIGATSICDGIPLTFASFDKRDVLGCLLSVAASLKVTGVRLFSIVLKGDFFHIVWKGDCGEVEGRDRGAETDAEPFAQQLLTSTRVVIHPLTKHQHTNAILMNGHSQNRFKSS